MSMLEIRRANQDEYILVRDFYYDVIDHIGDLEYRPGWCKGVYPEDEYLEESVAKGELYLGELDGQLVSAMIVNESGNESYDNGNWSQKLERGEYMVIHALCVHPRQKRQGLAKQMVDYALSLAADCGKQAIRLDVLKGNRSAENLYKTIGFTHSDTIPMYYEDTGWTEFLLYEIDITE